MNPNPATVKAQAKLAMNAVVNIAGNTVIITMLSQVLPQPYLGFVFLAFNLIQVIRAFTDPTFAIHLIQTGQMAPPIPPQS